MDIIIMTRCIFYYTIDDPKFYVHVLYGLRVIYRTFLSI